MLDLSILITSQTFPNLQSSIKDKNVGSSDIAEGYKNMKKCSSTSSSVLELCLVYVERKVARNRKGEEGMKWRTKSLSASKTKSMEGFMLLLVVYTDLLV